MSSQDGEDDEYDQEQDVQTIVDSVAWSPDGNLLAIASGDYLDMPAEPPNLRVWVVNPATGEVEFTTTHDGVARLAWYPSGDHLLIFSGTDLFQRYHVTTGVLELEVTAREARKWYDLEGMSFSPDGNRLAAVFTRLRGPQAFIIFDAQSLAPLLSVDLEFSDSERGNITWVGYSPDGRLLATTGWDGIVRLWDAGTLVPLTTLSTSPGQRLYAGSWTADGRLAVGGRDQRITIWNTTTGQVVNSIDVGGPISTLHWHPDERQLVAGSSVWDSVTGQQLPSVPWNRSEVQSIRAYPSKAMDVSSSGILVRGIRTQGRLQLDSNVNPLDVLVSSGNIQAMASPAPEVTIDRADTQSDPTNSSPVRFTIEFSEPVTGLDGSEVDLSASTAPGTLTAVVTGSDATYDVEVSGMTGDGLVVARLLANAAQNTLGIGNLPSTSTNNSVMYIAPTPPSVTLTQADSQSDPSNSGPISFTATFNEPVTGFDGIDIDLNGSTALGTLTTSVSGSGANYTVEVSGMTGDGTVVVSIPANAAQSAVGLGNEASTSADNVVTYDGTPPSVTINQVSTQTDPVSLAPIVFDVVFSEPVTGFGAESSNVSFAGSTAGGSLSATINGSGTTYTVSVSGMTTDGTVVVSIPAGAVQDAAGNSNTESTSTDNVVTYDSTPPAVTINQASTQADPTLSTSLQFTTTFSEPVIGFEASDVLLSGTAAATTAVVSGEGPTYTVTVSGMTAGGMVIANIPAGAVQDVAGNLNTASTSTDNIVTYDPTRPSVTINQASTQADPVSLAPVRFDVVFSEPVTGFGAQSNDVSLTGSTAGGTLSASISGSGTTYTVTVSGMSSGGTIVVTVPANAAQDAAGNANTASTSTDNVVTYFTPLPEISGLYGEYYYDENLSNLAFNRVDANINFNWGTTPPHNSLDPDSYSIRWTGTVLPQYSETYKFTVIYNDGVRLWVNNQQLIDDFVDGSTDTRSGSLTLTAGQPVTIRLEYLQSGPSEAHVELRWSSPSRSSQIIPSTRLFTVQRGNGTGLRGQYYDDVAMTELVTTRTDARVDFDWGTGSPIHSMDANSFAVQWTGQAQPLYTETFTFRVRSDDGVRLWVNGNLLIDDWTTGGYRVNTASVALQAGAKYPIVLEYREANENASVIVQWESASQYRQTIPKTQLYLPTS